MADDNLIDRRQFLGAAALSLAVLSSRWPEATPLSSRRSEASVGISQFAPIRQIVAGELNVGYAEDGPTNGQPVILLHG